MEFQQLLITRYSCRCFLDKPVSTTLISDLAKLAQKAPSWGNTQPWKIYAITGSKALAIRNKLVQANILNLAEQPEIPMPSNFDELLMNRYRSLGKELFTTLGINRQEKNKRNEHYLNNFNAFGAPVLIYITVPTEQTPYVILDAGAFITTFCLAASEQGLATCILAALARHPQLVRSIINIPKEENILIGLALGYPDSTALINQFRSSRAPLEEILTFINS